MLDLILIGAGFGVAAAIRFDSSMLISELDDMAVLLPLYLGLAIYSDSYSIAALQIPREGAQRATRSLVIAAAIFLGIAFSLKVSSQFSRSVFGIGIVAALGFLLIGRWLAVRWIGNRLKWNFTTNIVLVDRVPYSPRQGEVMIFANDVGLTPENADPHALDRLGQFLMNADRVVLACLPALRPMWIKMLRGVAVDVELLVPELDLKGALSIRRLGNETTVVVGVSPLGLRDRALKRALDLAIAFPAFVLLAPLILAIGVAVKLDSPGPILFRQPRVGLGNRIFYVLKFRSMRADCADEAGGNSTHRADERFTRVGEFIRRTSLDELPQLLNVITGEMSLVGPRPHALGSTAEDQPFWVIETRYFDRHSVKPGMTGLAQVRGYRGATEVRTDLINRVDADLEYIRKWNISLDLLIMLRTVRILASGKAY